MIRIVKEDPALRGPDGVKEDCVFCGFPTDTWHEATNNPVCDYCCKVHLVSELTDNIALGKRAEKVRKKTQAERERSQLESKKYRLRKLGIKVYHEKYNGDDEYSWAVFRSDRHAPVVTGLHWRQLAHYKLQVTNQVMKENGIA